MKGLVIAVDGPSSAGKGTVARGVARALGYRYLDTGAMYRAIGLRALRAGLSLDDGPALGALSSGLAFGFQWNGERLLVLVDGQDVTTAIRTPAVSRAASTVSRHPEVRAALLELQRELAREGAVVMDGRDIGTVVLPHAHVKIYLDAALEERARRRHAEMAEKGEHTPLEGVRADIAARDRQDTERAVAPLRPAADAVHLDTTDLTVDEAVDAVLAVVARLGKTG